MSTRRALTLPLLFARVRFGCTALTWASRNGNLDVMRFLLEKDGDVESVSYGGFKPIHHAANMSKEVIIRELISSGCNVSSLDDGGNTALHWAAARCVMRDRMCRGV